MTVPSPEQARAAAERVLALKVPRNGRDGRTSVSDNKVLRDSALPLAEFVAALPAEPAADARLAAVKALHAPVPAGWGNSLLLCQECRATWPCPTIAALSSPAPAAPVEPDRVWATVRVVRVDRRQRQARSLPDSTTSGGEQPCRCHQNFAYIAPRHAGHCCFVPATQTCHPEAVAAWDAERETRRPTPTTEEPTDA